MALTSGRGWFVDEKKNPEASVFDRKRGWKCDRREGEGGLEDSRLSCAPGGRILGRSKATCIHTVFWARPGGELGGLEADGIAKEGKRRNLLRSEQGTSVRNTIDV